MSDQSGFTTFDRAECGVSYEHTNPVPLGDGTWECKDCGNEYYDGEDGTEDDRS